MLFLRRYRPLPRFDRTQFPLFPVADPGDWIKKRQRFDIFTQEGKKYDSTLLSHEG